MPACRPLYQGERPPRYVGSDDQSEAGLVLRTESIFANSTDFFEENKSDFPNIITCPSELVALSAALGYAQATGLPV